MSDFDPDLIYTQLIHAGEEWADKDAAAQMLEENKKSILAHLMIEAPGSTSAEKERLALADPSYKHHLKLMVTARKEATVAKVRYDAMRVLSEMRRTQESTRRAEIGIR